MADGMDTKAHASTYDGFLVMMKWGTIASVIVAAFVILLIAG